jgi:iron complex outermembrane receptor protein
LKTLSLRLLTALLATTALSPVVAHAEGDTTEIVVTGARPEKPPSTTESTTAETLSRTTSVVTPEDALRYLPNLTVRQRHLGDTQSPVTTRTSGVGASARSLIYVDGILISALIGNNNSSASPKWGLIAPEAISRVDVMYGPFSAAYPGNSMGAVIEVTTRMPETLEGSLEVQGASQSFKKYGDDDTYGTAHLAASAGDRIGRFAWRLGVNHLDSQSQPLSYVTAAAAPAGTTGSFGDFNRLGAPIKVLGSSGLEHQIQDTVSGRLTYDLGNATTAAYTFGLFGNRDSAHVNTYLRGGGGNPAYTSGFLSGVYRLEETQLAQALSLASHTSGVFDYELVATQFNTLKSRQQTPTVLATWRSEGAGSAAELDGTGWTTLDAKGTWRPQGRDGAHILSFGLHGDRFVLDNPKYALNNWQTGDDGALQTLSQGQTRTLGAWVQDAWRMTPQLKATLGLRFDDWRASHGRNYSATPALDAARPERHATGVSPKAVVAWSPDDDWTFKASVGLAYRFPTVTELYQAVTTGVQLSTPDPNLRPERAVSTELSAERVWPKVSVRVSLFDEHIAHTLLSQTGTLNGAAVSFVQNVDRTYASGIELVADRQDILPGVDLSGWVTYVDARTDRDAVYPAAEGKRLPQIPRLRGAVVATWRASRKLDLSLAARYSDRAYATMDNVDVYANTYQGFSGYFVMDAHVRYKIDRHWTLDGGVTNLNNRSYFLFHPFPQRMALAGLKYNF